MAGSRRTTLTVMRPTNVLRLIKLMKSCSDRANTEKVNCSSQSICVPIHGGAAQPDTHTQRQSHAHDTSRWT
jgi:hypothetical protein